MAIILTLWIGNGAVLKKFQSIAVEELKKKKKKSLTEQLNFQ